MTKKTNQGEQLVIIKVLLPTVVKKKMKMYESMNTMNAQRKESLKLEKKFKIPLIL
jgi:hypothetical protein